MDKIAIIGGSGFENPDFLTNAEEVLIETPYGEVIAKTGFVQSVPVVLISRHGKHHTIPPHKVNNRANIMAIKQLQCSAIIATTACGSLRSEIEPGHFVVPDQFIDFTKHRISTFHDSFEASNMKHTPMADPFDAHLRQILIDAGEMSSIRIHHRGTIVTIEGPRFSTRAESRMFRMWGADIINMSTAPEACLAVEANIPYAAIAMSTDYDCWNESEEPVTGAAVLAVFRKNIQLMITLLQHAINTLKNG
jgi:5'-methylthioadenosine phosphorylase